MGHNVTNLKRERDDDRVYKTLNVSTVVFVGEGNVFNPTNIQKDLLGLLLFPWYTVLV